MDEALARVEKDIAVLQQAIADSDRLTQRIFTEHEKALALALAALTQNAQHGDRSRGMWLAMGVAALPGLAALAAYLLKHGG